MRKLTITLALFTIANLGFAQQKYYDFSINGKYGITDVNGNEMIKPIYSFATSIPAKNQIYLQDFSDKPDIIFNVKTGAKQLYVSAYANQAQINGVPYSIINNKGKKYLLSEESDKTLVMTRDYDDFYAVGNYIIANYYAQDPIVSGGKDKNGFLLPPKIREIKKNYVVLSNNESLKTIVDKGFDKYLPLYKTPEEKKGDGNVQAVEVILTSPIKESNPIFDYIVLSKGSNHRLFNAKMVLVKAFVLAKADEDALIAYAEKLLKVNISKHASTEHGVVSAPTMMGPSMGTRRNNSEQKPEEKKPFKPFFYTKKLDNGNTIFALQESEEISKRIFEAKPTSTIKLYETDSYIDVKIAGKENSRFYFDRKTGEIYLPKAYLTSLGITLI